MPNGPTYCFDSFNFTLINCYPYITLFRSIFQETNCICFINLSVFEMGNYQYLEINFVNHVF